MSVVTISQVIMIAYHLHGQTGRFTAWVVGRQDSGLVKFLSRNHLYQLHKSSSFTEKRRRKPEADIKDGFEELGHTFPFGKFQPVKQDYPFRCSVAPGNFPLTRPVFPLLSNRICMPENFCKW